LFSSLFVSIPMTFVSILFPPHWSFDGPASLFLLFIARVRLSPPSCTTPPSGPNFLATLLFFRLMSSFPPYFPLRVSVIPSGTLVFPFCFVFFFRSPGIRIFFFFTFFLRVRLEGWCLFIVHHLIRRVSSPFFEVCFLIRRERNSGAFGLIIPPGLRCTIYFPPSPHLPPLFFLYHTCVNFHVPLRPPRNLILFILSPRFLPHYLWRSPNCLQSHQLPPPVEQPLLLSVPRCFPNYFLRPPSCHFFYSTDSFLRDSTCWVGPAAALLVLLIYNFSNGGKSFLSSSLILFFSFFFCALPFSPPTFLVFLLPSFSWAKGCIGSPRAHWAAVLLKHQRRVRVVVDFLLRLFFLSVTPFTPTPGCHAVPLVFFIAAQCNFLSEIISLSYGLWS